MCIRDSVDNLMCECDGSFGVLVCDQCIDCDHAAQYSLDAKAPDGCVGGFCVLGRQPRYEIRSGFIAWSCAPQYSQLCVPLGGKLKTALWPPAAM